MSRISTTVCFLSQCTIAVLIYVYFFMFSPNVGTFLGERRMTPDIKTPLGKSSKYFGLKEIGHLRTVTNVSNSAVGRYPLKQTIQKSFYDIAVISMTRYWYSHSTLPREIRCNSTKTSILIRRATEEEDNIKRADILIFAANFPNVFNWTSLQLLRHSWQLWVHTTEESPFTSLSICPLKTI